MRLEERETTVNYTDADTVATVMSYNAAMASRLKRLLAEHPDEVTLVWESEGGVEVRLPKKWIKVQPPPTISDERREAMRESMQRLRRSSGENEQN
jgi:hypothetical protein